MSPWLRLQQICTVFAIFYENWAAELAAVTLKKSLLQALSSSLWKDMILLGASPWARHQLDKFYAIPPIADNLDYRPKRSVLEKEGPVIGGWS